MGEKIDVIDVETPKPKIQTQTAQTLQRNQSFIEKINFSKLNSGTIIGLIILVVELAVGIIEGFLMKKCEQ